jgi:hypothetical protein
MERDFDKHPYTPDERRVCEFLQTLAPDIGCGDDPIGFLLACYRMLADERRTLRELACDRRISPELIGIRVRNSINQ